jgi:hypothetical protein
MNNNLKSKYHMARDIDTELFSRFFGNRNWKFRVKPDEFFPDEEYY